MAGPGRRIGTGFLLATVAAVALLVAQPRPGSSRAASMPLTRERSRVTNTPLAPTPVTRAA